METLRARFRHFNILLRHEDNIVPNNFSANSNAKPRGWRFQDQQQTDAKGFDQLLNLLCSSVKLRLIYSKITAIEKNLTSTVQDVLL